MIKEKILQKVKEKDAKSDEITKIEHETSELIESTTGSFKEIHEKLNQIEQKTDEVRALCRLPNNTYDYGAVLSGMTTKLVRTPIVLNEYTGHDGTLRYRNIVTINVNGLNSKTEYVNQNYKTRGYSLRFSKFLAIVLDDTKAEQLINSVGKANGKRIRATIDAFKEWITKNPALNVKRVEKDEFDAFDKIKTTVNDSKELTIKKEIKDFKIVRVSSEYDTNKDARILQPIITTLNLKRIFIDLNRDEFLRIEYENTNGEIEQIGLTEHEITLTLEPYKDEINELLNKTLAKLNEWFNIIQPLNDELKEKLAPYTLAKEL